MSFKTYEEKMLRQKVLTCPVTGRCWILVKDEVEKHAEEQKKSSETVQVITVQDFMAVARSQKLLTCHLTGEFTELHEDGEEYAATSVVTTTSIMDVEKPQKNPKKRLRGNPFVAEFMIEGTCDDWYMNMSDQSVSIQPNDPKGYLLLKQDLTLLDSRLCVGAKVEEFRIFLAEVEDDKEFCIILKTDRDEYEDPDEASIIYFALDSCCYRPAKRASASITQDANAE